MKQEIKAEWLRRLRSGKIKQGREYLHRVSGEQCCLGVLCEMAVEAGVLKRTIRVSTPDVFAYHDCSAPSGDIGGLSAKVMDWAGLYEDGTPGWVEVGPRDLATLNDSGMTFAEIADIIEEQL